MHEAFQLRPGFRSGASGYVACLAVLWQTWKATVVQPTGGNSVANVASRHVCEAWRHGYAHWPRNLGFAGSLALRMLSACRMGRF